MYKLFFLILILINLNLCYSKAEYRCGDVLKTTIAGPFIRDVSDQEHPWFCDYDVEINRNKKHCGGALISNELIVTSLSCFNSSEYFNLEKAVNNLKCGHVKITLLKVVTQPAFDPEYHDFAVFKIKRISYSTYIRPICVLEYENLLMNSEVIVVASGSHYLSNEKKPHYAKLTLRDATLCQDKSSKNNESFCAGELFTPLRNGDIGSPMIVEHQNRYYLVGLASKLGGLFDGISKPSRFTRIMPHCKFLKTYAGFDCLSNTVPLRQEFRKNEKSCGHTIKDHYHPWYCRLYADDNSDFCGGTLISNKYVLTAAHCLTRYNIKHIKCGTGFQIMKQIIGKPIPHRKYNTKKATNDIAVIQIAEEIDVSLKTASICIPSKNVVLGNQNLIAIGMNVRNNTSMTEFMTKITKPLDCIHRELSFENDNTICVISNGKGIKKGDSGGPLLGKENGIYYIIGILSKGDYDPTYNVTVSSYTRIQDYLDFITGTTKVKPSKSSTLTLNLLQIVVFIFIVIYF